VSDRKLRLEHSVVDLKLNKSKCKRAFTCYRNKLTDELRDESPDRTLAKENLDQVERSMDDAVEVISQLAKTATLYNKTFDESVKADSDSETEQQNLSQVGRFVETIEKGSIPLFYGDVNKYEGWKAAFDSCIDAAPTSAEYKLL